MFAPRVSMFLVSIPARVSNSAMSSGFFGRSTSSRSQLTENFIFSQSHSERSRGIPPVLPECTATGCLDFARHDETVLTQTVSKTADHSARKVGYQEFRIESSPADPCQARMHIRSTFRDRKHYRHALR